MSLKTDALAPTKVKDGASTMVEAGTHTPARPHDGRVIKLGAARRAKTEAAAETVNLDLDPELDTDDSDADALVPQDALHALQTPYGSADESVALAAVDPTWYVEPGTAPAATDAPRPRWFAAPALPEPTVTETSIGTVIGAPAPVASAPVVRGPALSPMGLNALGIGLGGLGLGLGLAGGGGSGTSNTGGGVNTAYKALTTTIKVVDGPISGASVFWDMNDNGKYDAGVDKPVSDIGTKADGSLEIATASLGPHGLLAVGGTNDNGMPNASTLSLVVLANTSAPLVVVSPLTSLASAVYLQARQSDPNARFSDAENTVKSALGIESTQSLSSTDPTGAGEFALLQAGVVLANLAAVPESVAASVQDSLATYLLRNKPSGGALLGQLTSNVGLQTVFASGLENLSGTDKQAALTSLNALASNNAKLVAATSASELGSVADLSSNETAIPKILALKHDTGASNTDKITSLAQLSVSALGGTTQLSIDKGATWFDASDFAPPDGTLTVIARSKYGTNSAGKVVFSGSSDPFSFTLRTVVPAAPTIGLFDDTGVSKTDRITKVGTFKVTSAPTDGSLLQYSTDGRNWAESLSSTQNEALKQDGAHTVYVRHVLPSVGLSSAVNRLGFTLDNRIAAGMPELVGADTSSTANITSNEQPTLKGRTDPGNTVEFTLDGTAYKVIADSNGAWSFDPTLTEQNYSFPEGSLEIALTTSDAAGNTIGKLLAVTIDLTAPDDTTVSFDAPTSEATVGVDVDGIAYFNPDSISADTPLTFLGTADPGATVDLYVADTYLDTVTASADDGSWSFDWDGLVDGSALAEETYTLQLVVTDLAGNISDT
ncbi:MAG: Ig-like domain-containing protein, partial [Rhodoferax sp.]|nr:Ig-like domain-containing protein [Rhodoferax sp.]